MNEAPVGLLISNDLFFTSKVTSTAEALGLRVRVAASASQAKTWIDDNNPRVVLVDLNAGVAAGSDAIKTYRAALSEGARLVAFGSHVDTDALAAATAAGCDEVMPRSKFSAGLPENLRRWLS